MAFVILIVAILVELLFRPRFNHDDEAIYLWVGRKERILLIKINYGD